ncbi:MAG: methyltransferase domain-containing protein [Gemmatimonadota bacterium]
MTTTVRAAAVDADELRAGISAKYEEVALTPEKGFHFHTGSRLASMLDYDDDIVEWLPDGTVDSFAGTGNPFSMGDLASGETVLDIGCGAGMDTLIAARQVGPDGHVIAVDMTGAMLRKAERCATEVGLTNISFREGLAESLPADDGTVDVVISNGVINLCPDKVAVMKEIRRVLRPGGRFQIADIVVHKEVPQGAKDDIELWSG